jgi:AraC-like DNA-binding protein
MIDIRFSNFIPHPALGHLIRAFVVVEADLGPVPEKMEGFYMPSPHQNMFIHIHSRLKVKKATEQEFSTRSNCIVVGAQFTPVKLMAEESHKAVIVVFQPGGLNRLLGIPLVELHDDGFDARDIIGNEIDELIDKCHEANGASEIFEMVQDYFLKKLSRVDEELPIDKALQHLFQNYNEKIDVIASLACMSQRQFERKCKERLGMSAKLYARIARFNKAYNLFVQNKSVQWTDIAYQAGYYDQMHFIRDFKVFALATPTLIGQDVEKEKIKFQLDWGRI